MTAKKSLVSGVLASLVVLLFYGCAPEADVALKPEPGMVSTYKNVDVFRKEYLFDQPNSNQKTEKLTESDMETVFEQYVKDVDDKGNTIADITIKALKYSNTNANTLQIDFDSSRDTDSSSALAALIGQTYTIKLSPNGKVLEISNIDSAREAVSTGPDAAIAERFFREIAVRRRHEILAMPGENKRTLKVGDSWSEVVPSPQGVLIPKNYEKVYTVTEITDGKRALIEMLATPTTKQLDSKSEGDEAIDVFRSFFDSEDDYNGRLLFDTETGKVYDYSENYTSRYTAAEFPKGAKGKPKPEQPDVLKLAFIEKHSTELID